MNIKFPQRPSAQADDGLGAGLVITLHQMPAPTQFATWSAEVNMDQIDTLSLCYAPA